MGTIRVGDRVFLRYDPSQIGTVLRLYTYGSLTIKHWADVKWDRVSFPGSGDQSSVPADLLEKL